MNKIIAVAVLICMILVLLIEPMGFAWMSDNGLSSPINIGSNVHKSYFESGDGTKEIVKNDDGDIISGPYEIAHPIQLYYFSWLQYLGYFNQDNDEDGAIDTVYFRLSQDIDMKEDGMQFVLPPIGSQDNPFLGSFDGEGNSIKNLVVQNVDDGITESPATGGITGVEIVGFFGVIGSLEGDTYSYDTSANEIKNFVLENLTVKTQTNNALIGLVAGYVNGIVDCVGVVGSTVDIKSGTTPLSYTGNLSDYSLIGYCTDGFANDLICVDLDAFSPDVNIYEVVPDNTSDGQGQGWGGSIAMDDMFTFVQAMMSKAKDTPNYVYEKITAVTLDGTNSTVSSLTAGKKLLYDSSIGASFVFSPRGNNDTNYSYNTQYTYLSGGVRVTEYQYNYKDNDVAVYYITDNTYYLNFDGNNISSTTDRANATKWYASNGTSGGTLYTVINKTVYYLTIQNNSITVVSDAQADPGNLPSWSIKNSTLFLGSQAIECYNGTWVAVSDFCLISNGTHYLTADGTTRLKDEDEDNATKWTVNINGNTATISTLIGETRYYVGATATSNNNATLTLSTTLTNWTYNATNNRFSISLRYNYRSRTYYIRYNNGWMGSSTSQNLTLTEDYSNLGNSSIISSGTTAKEITVTSKEYVDNTLVKNGETIETGITYYPLSLSLDGSTYSTSTGNTGYVISSSYSTKTSDNHATNGTGDIRVSRYTTSEKLTGYTTPYSISYKTNDSFERISTNNAANYGLIKFNDCYDDYTSSIATNCYGLHFMEATINIDSLITVEKAQIIGESYSNYQLPTNCIDFNLAEQGFINFAAGAYFADNNSFFSLHKIDRDSDNNITAIKEIDLIYGYVKSDGTLDPNKQYYYTYKNAESDPGMPSGTDSEGGKYEVIFKTDWIINPNSHGVTISQAVGEKYYAYYFEVPVYAGEYALGSAGDDKIGAYLIYLDLAANAQVIERTRVDEKTVTVEKEVTLPNGVSMLEKNDSGYTTDSISSKDSAFASIGAGFSGSASFSQSGTTITDSAKGHTATYVADGVTLVDGDGNSMTVPITKTVTVEKTTYHDVNLVTKEQTVTVIVKTTETVGSTTEVSYTKNVTKTASDGTVTPLEEQTSSTELLPDVHDPETNPPVIEIGENLIDISYLASDTEKFLIETSYTPEGEDESGNATSSVYTFTVTNTTGEAVELLATLTAEGVSSGITFIINDGTTQTTLNNNTDTQTVTIAASAEGA